MHGVDVAGLTVSTRAQIAPAVEDALAAGPTSFVTALDDRQGRADILRLDLSVLPQELPHLLEDTLSLVYLLSRAVDRERVAAGNQPHGKGVADHAQVGVARAKDLHRLIAAVEGDGAGFVHR
jgi:hypothetical protein